MKEEDNYTVWSNIAGYLNKIHNLLCETNFHHLFRIFGLEIMKPIYNKLGCENKSDESNLFYFNFICNSFQLKIDTTLVFFRSSHIAIEKSCVESVSEISRHRVCQHCLGEIRETLPRDLHYSS